MSSTINQKQSLWKMVEASLRSTLMENSAGGITVLTADDAATWSRTLVLNCLILQDLLSDGFRLRSDGSLKQWCNAMAKTDILILAGGLKEFQHFLRVYPDEWEFLSYSDFKHRYPFGFTGDFWSPVKDILISYLANPLPATFRVLNQWVSFPLKLTLKGIASSLTAKAEQDYLDNEVRLASLALPLDLCDEISIVLKEWFSGLNIRENFFPHHGPGATANRKTRDGLLGKYRHMQSDVRISFLYRRYGLEERSYRFSSRCTAAPRAKLITVPKGIDKRRSICPEPAEYQFNQQGIWGALDKFIQGHPVLRTKIAIHDQNVNRRAALMASKYQDAATIDLSSASDSVSWAWVKCCCRRSPELLWALWATRSTEVTLPSGRVIVTEKYAPMGSALCFPMESILFAAICQVAENHTTGRTRDSYHVYGDDLIVPAVQYSEVLTSLMRCGFLVNEHKTFDPYCRYKESCGIEALDGEDVSVLGISRKFSADTLRIDRPKLVSCYVSLANDLFSHGFMAARTYVLSYVLSLPSNLVPPFSGVHGVGIFSSDPTNWQTIVRYNERIMEEEVLVGCITTTKDLDSFTADQAQLDRKYGTDYGEIRYHEILRRYHETKRSGLTWPEDLIQVTLSKTMPRLSSRWVPSYWFQNSVEALPLIDGRGETLSFAFVLTKHWGEWVE